jgi:hypothetical protein
MKSRKASLMENIEEFDKQPPIEVVDTTHQ